MDDSVLQPSVARLHRQGLCVFDVMEADRPAYVTKDNLS